ncbi:MAG: glycosyltransferase family 1 protein [Ferruginibacter sp.]
MKIILDCELMKHRDSGLYHYCLNLGLSVEKIFDSSDNSHCISFYVPEIEKRSFGKADSVIVEHKYHKFAKPFLCNCDIWHAPFQSGRIIPKSSQIKVLLTVHDLNQLHEGKPLEQQQKSLSHTQSLIQRSDAIVCISEFTKNDVLENCEVGNKPVYVIHNGIHDVCVEENFIPSVKPRLPFLFGLGYINSKKNFHVLIPLLKKNPGLEMVIAGRLDEPDYIYAMRESAEKLGVSERLHITGPVCEKTKGWYLRNCLAFMHPSLAEGFGAPVVEAMQFGKPLFLSNKTALPEIGANAAFYFSDFNEDYMQYQFQEGMKQFKKYEMQDMVIARAAEFNWQKNALKYIEVYKSLV